MSAKWRRNKKSPKRFDIFRTFRKAKEKDTSHVFRFKTSWVKKKTYPKEQIILKTRKERRTRELEPLVDVLEENDEVIVVAEFAGFNKENIKTSVKDQRLTLSAKGIDRKFYKSLNLPKRVIPTTIRTAYKNGVFEVRLKKQVENKAIGNVAG